MRSISANFISILYKRIAKPIFFLSDAETVHESVVNIGKHIGDNVIAKQFFKYIFYYQDKKLAQNLFNIKFENPIGLSAGFDYNASLTQILPALSFGFETVGTITNLPYEGNPKPRLGRLPKSKSLLVNKGFKNLGIETVLQRLSNKRFLIPIGISIGQTNSKNITTLKEAIDDIVSAFKKTERSKIPFSYYELNISCPNLNTSLSFYPPENLNELLKQVTNLKLKQPLFIKMPIEKSNKEVESMLDVIIKYPVQGVIFGNLQKNRNDPAIDQNEAKKFTRGNFSGKPTEKKSNELIKLCYKKYGKKLVIIGCGGVFSAQDAYKKIKLGATLVQLITGLVFEGPQLVTQINMELSELLEKDGYKNISEAIGKEHK